jgi:N-acyl-L-homoserine lactone synthetase
MIVTVYGSQQSSYPELFDDMFRMRARVFKDRLNWSCPQRWCS